MLLRAVWGLVVASLLAACTPAPRSEPGPHLVLRHSRMPGDRDPLPALLREFERRHPGVTVAREPLPWTADVQHQFYVINLEGGSAGFDVLMRAVIWVAEFARAGWLLDVSDRWPPAERREHFPAVVEAGLFQERAWAVPWVTNVGLLYYRTDLLARHGFGPPRTDEELAEQAARVQQREGRADLHRFVWQGKPYEGLVVNVLETFWAWDTDVLGSDGTVIPDPDRARRPRLPPRSPAHRDLPPLVTAADAEMSRREFGAGRAVFLRNWPYALPLFEAEGSAVRGRVGIAPLPGGGALGGAHLGINRRTAIRTSRARWSSISPDPRRRTPSRRPPGSIRRDRGSSRPRRCARSSMARVPVPSRPGTRRSRPRSWWPASSARWTPSASSTCPSS